MKNFTRVKEREKLGQGLEPEIFLEVPQELQPLSSFHLRLFLGLANLTDKMRHFWCFFAPSPPKSGQTMVLVGAANSYVKKIRTII